MALDDQGPVHDQCPLAGDSIPPRSIIVLLELLGKRWMLRVVWELGLARTIRFSELQQQCGISPTVLSKRLNELTLARIVEQDGRLYRLTELGHQLLRTLLQLSSWSDEWLAARAETAMLGPSAPAGAGPAAVSPHPAAITS